MLRPVSRCPADNPTYRRSWRRRSASFTSSYPARRPNTDCRSKPTNAWRPFLPVRASASISPAISVKQSASSSSRYANNPASDVTTDPQNWSIRRRLKSSRTTSDSASPVGCAMSSLDHRRESCSTQCVIRGMRVEATPNLGGGLIIVANFSQRPTLHGVVLQNFFPRARPVVRRHIRSRLRSKPQDRD